MQHKDCSLTDEDIKLRYNLKICKKCDWLIYNKRIINLTNTNNPKNVCLNKTASLGGLEIMFPFFINQVLPLIKNKFNLIITSSDQTFPYSTDLRYKKTPNINILLNILYNNSYLNKIFVENLDTIHPKCVPIPIGAIKNICKKFDFDMIPYNSLRNINVFCCHRKRPQMQFKDRDIVSNLCLNEWKKFVHHADNLSQEEFFKNMLQSKFTICVHGGGIDPCPKAFEAMICGSIPIIQHSTMDAVWEKFPVVLVDNWHKDSITEQKLNRWYNKLKNRYIDVDKRKECIEMMTMDYWWNIIDKSF